MAVQKGDTIKIEYVGKYEDGSVFDSSEKQGQPLQFTVGNGQIIKGLDDAILGMEEGDQKEIEINPQDGYGEHNPDLVQKVPRDKFPQEMDVQPGTVFEAGLPSGETVPANVVDVDDEGVSVDLNHPLAGKKLNFSVKVVEIGSTPSESDASSSAQSSE